MLPLGATSQLVDCHLSLVFLQIDGFQNVFWHVRAACVVASFGSFALTPLFISFVSAFVSGIEVKKSSFFTLNILSQIKLRNRHCKSFAGYNSNMQMLRIIWGSSHLRVASAHNSVNLFSGIWFHTQLTMHNSM